MSSFHTPVPNDWQRHRAKADAIGERKTRLTGVPPQASTGAYWCSSSPAERFPPSRVPLKNTSGYAGFEGTVLQGAELSSLVQGLASNGLLGGYTHMLTVRHVSDFRPLPSVVAQSFAPKDIDHLSMLYR